MWRQLNQNSCHKHFCLDNLGPAPSPASPPSSAQPSQATRGRVLIYGRDYAETRSGATDADLGMVEGGERGEGREHKHEPSPPHPRHTGHHWPDPGRGFREILLPRINSGWAVKIFMKSSPSRQPRFSELLLPGPRRDQQIASINTESGAATRHSQCLVNGSMLRPILR